MMVTDYPRMDLRLNKEKDKTLFFVLSMESTNAVLCRLETCMVLTF